MRVLSILFLSTSLLQQQSGLYPSKVTIATHPRLTRGQILATPVRNEPTAFRQLLSLALANRMPLGIVVDDPNLCRLPLRLPDGVVTVQRLAGAVEQQMPGYRVDIQQGVLNITPVTMPKLAADLLSFRLQSFQTSADLIKFMAQGVWFQLRSQTVPGEGSTGGGLSGPEEELVHGMNLADVTTETVLNILVDRGSGGFWLVRTSDVKELHTPWLASPIGAWGYRGAEGYLVGYAKCEK